jgi:hypothetical protein
MKYHARIFISTFTIRLPATFCGFGLFELTNSWLGLGNERFEALQEIFMAFENVVSHLGSDKRNTGFVRSIWCAGAIDVRESFEKPSVTLRIFCETVLVRYVRE